jgi:hypothetical protein
VETALAALAADFAARETRSHSGVAGSSEPRDD